MRPVTDRLAWSVRLTVSRSVCHSAKTAEAIEMPFGLRAWMGPENHVLDEGLDPPMGTVNF